MEDNCLNEDIPVMSLELRPKIRAFQIHYHHNILPLGSKREKAQYEKNQRCKEDRKIKRGRENENGERGGGGHQENNLIR